MRLDYDEKSDAAYIWLKPPNGTITVAKTVPVDPRAIEGEINLDLDSEGRLVGIEILSASTFLDDRLLQLARGA